MVQQQTRKSRAVCAVSGHSVASAPSLKLRNLSRLQTPRTEPETTSGAAPVKATREHSRSGTAKADFYWNDPLSDPRHQHRSYVWLHHQHLEHQLQMVPNILIPAAPGFQVCRCFRVCQCSRVCKWFKDCRWSRECQWFRVADASGNPDGPGRSMISHRYKPTVLQAPVYNQLHQLPVRSHAQETLQENCRGKHLQKCGQFKTSVTGHSQYRGRVYCHRLRLLQKNSG